MQEFIGCYSIWIAYRAVFDKTEYRLVISRVLRLVLRRDLRLDRDLPDRLVRRRADSDPNPVERESG